MLVAEEPPHPEALTSDGFYGEEKRKSPFFPSSSIPFLGSGIKESINVLLIVVGGVVARLLIWHDSLSHHLSLPDNATIGHTEVGHYVENFTA